MTIVIANNKPDWNQMKSVSLDSIRSIENFLQNVKKQTSDLNQLDPISKVEISRYLEKIRTKLTYLGTKTSPERVDKVIKEVILIKNLLNGEKRTRVNQEEIDKAFQEITATYPNTTQNKVDNPIAYTNEIDIKIINTNNTSSTDKRNRITTENNGKPYIGIRFIMGYEITTLIITFL